MKRCSTSLIVKEKQIETMTRRHLTPGRMTAVKATTVINKQKQTETQQALARAWRGASCPAVNGRTEAL